MVTTGREIGEPDFGGALQRWLNLERDRIVGGFSPPELLPSIHVSTTTARGESAAIHNKHTRYDWGLLEGLLNHFRESAPASPPPKK